MFLQNLDRTMLTFNLHNMAEVCFSHVFKRGRMASGEETVSPDRLNPGQQAAVDECIEKYMQAFRVVEAAVHAEIVNLNE
jgi:hypothetical protein